MKLIEHSVILTESQIEQAEIFFACFAPNIVYVIDNWNEKNLSKQFGEIYNVQMQKQNNYQLRFFESVDTSHLEKFLQFLQLAATKVNTQHIHESGHHDKLEIINIGEKYHFFNQNVTDIHKTPYNFYMPFRQAFGTGYHATTQLIIEQLEHVPLTGKVVIDIGTGTGILALVAIAEGAKKVIGIDADQQAIIEAQQLAKDNQVDKVEYHVQNFLEIQVEPFDWIIANLSIDLFEQFLPFLCSQNIEKKQALFSGIAAEQVPTFLKILKSYNLSVIKQTAKNNWHCFHLVF